MNKKLFFLFFVQCFALFAKGQDVMYAGSIGNHAQVKVMDMAKTSNNELVIAVDFPGSRHFQFGKDPYCGLHKYNTTGEIEWNFQSLHRENVENKITVDYLFLNLTLDEADNIYGLVYTDIYSEVKVGEIIISPGLNLMKINPQGSIIWNKSIGKNAQEDNACIEYKNGKLYVIGTYQGDLNLDNNFFLKSQEYYQCYMWMYVSGADYFVAEYDTTGLLHNAVSLGENYPDELVSMTMDDSENLYFTGLSDNFPCVVPYTHITKLDKNLSVQWVDTISYSNESPKNIPMDIHYSKNGKIYVWNNSIDNIRHGDFVTDNKNPYLIEIDTNSGHVMRELNIKAELNTTPNYSSIIRRYVNGIIDDFGSNLIIHTAFSDKLIIKNDTTYSDIWEQFPYNSFVLLKIDLIDFSASLIKKFDGKIRDNEISNRYYFDMPGKIIVDEPYVYFTGDFGDDPLHIYDVPIFNKSGNDQDTDVFFCKIDMSSYLNLSGIADNKAISKNIIVFPNPVSEILQIQNEYEIIDVQIFTIDGYEMLSYKKTNSVNVSNLANGLYIMQVKTSNGITSTKFLVAH